MKKLYMVMLSIISVLSLLPFYIMLMISTHYSEDVYKGFIFLPGKFLIENVKTVMAGDFVKYYGNSLFVSTVSTVVCVFICALTGFALAKYDFRFKKFIYTFIVMTMMVPVQTGLVGYMMEMKFFHLNNTLVPLIIIWLTNAFGVFWMTQYMKFSVPDELIESGRIDGCNDFGIFLRIILPTIKPALATLSMLIFLWSWNSYLFPTVLINKKDMFTVPLFIANLGSLYRMDFGARMAALSFATIPLLIIFIMGSKTFISGLTAGAVKG